MCLVIGLAAVLPVRLELTVHKEGEWRVAAALRPFGRYGPRLLMSNKKRHPKASKKATLKRRTPTRKSRIDVAVVLRLLTDILGCINIGRLNVDARFGLGDPAATGQAFGTLAPVIYGTSALRGFRVHAVPVFDRPVLSGAAEIAFSVIPITLLGPAFRFGWSIIRTVR